MEKRAWVRDSFEKCPRPANFEEAELPAVTLDQAGNSGQQDSALEPKGGCWHIATLHSGYNTSAAGAPGAGRSNPAEPREQSRELTRKLRHGHLRDTSRVEGYRRMRRHGHGLFLVPATGVPLAGCVASGKSQHPDLRAPTSSLGRLLGASKEETGVRVLMKAVLRRCVCGFQG